MSTIKMKTGKLKVIKIHKKTKAKLFGDLKVGDLIQLSVSVKSVGQRTTGGTKAVDIQVENLQTGETTFKSFNEIGKLLPLFALAEEL